MMNREPIRNRAVNAFAARQIQYRPPLTRVFAKAVSYLAAYIDNNYCLQLAFTFTLQFMRFTFTEQFVNVAKHCGQFFLDFAGDLRGNWSSLGESNL